MARAKTRPVVEPEEETSVTAGERHELKQAARDRIIELAEANGGRITAEMVVEDARDPDSALHAYFEWDVDIAAKQYWLDQARTLIRSVKIVTREERKTVVSVGFVRDPSVDSTEQGYISVRKVRTDEEMARDVLLDEFRRAGAALDRARKLASVFQMSEALDEFVERLNMMRDHIAREQPARADA
jgi:hypothetical protein